MDLASEFSRLKLAHIQSYIAKGQEEHLQLDFITVNSAELSHGDDKKNLAKALSGFANSSGGLVIWGVDARKNNLKVDCASGSREIEPLRLFISRLNELTGSATSPLAEGVRHKPIQSSPGSGFAVTPIPESDAAPHMALLGERRYYKRNGDSFYPMEHFDLEDMFGRRKKPKLSLFAKVHGVGPRTSITIGIQNEGRGSAVAPYLAFNAPPPFQLFFWGVDGNRNEGLPRLHSRGGPLPHRYGGNTSFVIHPSTEIEVAALYLGMPAPQNIELPPSVQIDYEVTAQETQIVKSSLRVDLLNRTEQSGSA
ncbi:MAG: ATP-binding protein [Anaerolineales bacterium]|nr:ATP-binding protein [Anaerolineales bacterium]